MAGLSDGDRSLIKTLRSAGVLRDVDDHRLDQRDGVILVPCADGDRFHDLFERQAHMQADCRSDTRIHTLSWHGGALACAPKSPVNKNRFAAKVFLGQIADGRKLKGINTVALYAHVPCGAAGLANIGLREVISLQFSAKRTIKRLNHGITVAAFFHVDYGGGCKRTYFLSRPDWDKWARENKAAA